MTLGAVPRDRGGPSASGSAWTTWDEHAHAAQSARHHTFISRIDGTVQDVRYKQLPPPLLPSRRPASSRRRPPIVDGELSSGGDDNLGSQNQTLL